MPKSTDPTEPKFTVYTSLDILKKAPRDLGLVLSDLALRGDGPPLVVTCNKRGPSFERFIKGKWQIDVIPVDENEDWDRGEELEGLTKRCARFPESIDETARAALYKACAAGAKRIPSEEALAIIRGN